MKDGTGFADVDQAKQRRFTRTELEALTVPSDIALKLTDDLAADIPEDEIAPKSALPLWSQRRSARHKTGETHSWLEVHSGG